MLFQKASDRAAQQGQLAIDGAASRALALAGHLIGGHVLGFEVADAHVAQDRVDLFEV